MRVSGAEWKRFLHLISVLRVYETMPLASPLASSFTSFTFRPYVRQDSPTDRVSVTMCTGPHPKAAVYFAVFGPLFFFCWMSRFPRSML